MTAVPFDLTEQVCVALADDWRTWHGHMFDSRYDRVGRPASWDALALLAMVLQPVVGLRKDGLPLWSPTTFGPAYVHNGRKVCRRASNTCAVSMVVLDIDDGSSVDAVLQADTFAIAHTSFSHTPTHEKWRIIYPLAEPVPAQEWGKVWRGIAHRWPQVDAATKDPSRMYYVPAVRQRSSLLTGSEAGPLTYWRGTYQVRVQLGRWLTLPDPPPARAAVTLPRPPGMVLRAMLRTDKRQRLAAGILRTRAAELAGTSEGGRNLLLWRAAVACRRLSLAGVLDWQAAASELEVAGAASGLPGAEIVQTIGKGKMRGDEEGAWNDWG